MKIKINETFIFQNKISFAGFGKKIVDANVDPQESILDLKKRILKRYKLDDHPEIFSLIYKGSELSDDKKVSELGFKDGDTVHIICKEISRLDEILRDKGIL